MFIEKKDLEYTFGFTGPPTPGRPFLNVPRIGMINPFNSSSIADKKSLMWLVKRSPEAIGIVRAIAQDIVTSISFKSIAESKTRPIKQDKHKMNEEKASKFAKTNMFKQTLISTVMDWLITGEGFNWKGKDVKKDIIGNVFARLKENGVDFSEKELAEYKEYLDEDPDNHKKLVQASSTTITVLINKEGTGLEGFKQSVNGNHRIWKPEEIIHAKFMLLDGKPNGFSPMETCVPILKTLGAITDYHGHFFDSGGAPDLIFNFKTLGANEPGLAKYQQMIDEWANNKRRGHLVIGSEMDLERVNEMNKDMEFRLLAIYYTGRMAFSFGMPLEKFQMILGGEISSSTGSSDLGNADYQRNIADAQDYWETLYNTQFWNEEFDVDMCLARGFLQDQVRQLQVDTQKIAVMQGMIQMGLIKQEFIPEYVNMMFPEIPRNMIEPNPPRDWVAKGTGNDEKKSNDEVQKGQASKAYAAEKKSQQKPQSTNSPPNGS